MKTATTLLAIVVLGAVGAGGYWLGTRAPIVRPDAASADSAAASAPAAAPQRKLLYYRNPMGLADTSPTPKKDPMGMDYIAVYEGEDSGANSAAGAAGQIRISTEKIQKLGVRTEAARRLTLGRTVRASGRIEPDERRIYAISPKFEGYVERLHVNVTGQPVSKGQPLFEVYSPELVSAQREYAIAVEGMQAMKDAGPEAQAGMKQLAESSLARLRNWDISAEQLAALVSSGEASRSVTFRSPVSGLVTEKKAVQGMRFMPGEALYQVTDLSSVWVVADVFEQDIGLVRAGALAKVRINAYPDKVFEGRITYVYPTLNAETRTVPVRVELANPGQRLKPAMFAQVELAVGGTAPVLSVPDSAVIDSGMRKIVLVQVQEGRFEPREVKLGARSETHVQVLDGVREGEQVVVAANFLIDAESNLKAAIGGLGGHAGHGSAPAGAAPAAPAGPTPASSSGPAAAPTAVPATTPAAAPAAIGHKAEGSVDGIDLKAGTVSLQHGPVPSLKWPAMTMEFKAAHAGLLQGLKPGQAVSFEFVERQPGEYLLTAITPAPGAQSAAPAAPKAAAGKTPHSGH